MGLPLFDGLLNDLDESQRRAVTSPARPLAILAPAGSGKTRVLTRRIAWRVATDDAEEAHVLALTFTRKAAGELRARLERLGLREGVAAGTFHGIAYAQLRTRWVDRGQRAPELVARKAPVLGDLLRDMGPGNGLSPAALAGEIEWAKARLLGPDGYVEGVAQGRRRTTVPPERIASAYAAYEQLKAQRGLVDFDDLLKLCGDALLDDTTFAAAQRWRFRHLFVDEFQDVNPLQLRLLDAWRGDHYDLCVVGDTQQAIYGWNGADAGFLERFRRLYPSAEVLPLECNYRSPPQVLAAATQVLRRAKLHPTAARATQPDGTAPRIEGFASDMAEATGVARAVRDRRTPRTPWSAQAILVRTHAQIGLITEGLRAAQIPYKVRGETRVDQRRPRGDEPAVRAARDLLMSHDQRLLTSCLADLDALEAEMSAEPGAASTIGRLARDHVRIDPSATAAGFVAWLVATLQAEGVDAADDAVTVATFHAAKGLEWPVVHLAGLEDGFVPVRHARTTQQRAEEARLLYVAMTRAVHHLSCSWATVRSFNGRTVERRICPWLRDLADPTSDDAPPIQPPLSLESQRRLAHQRESLSKARQPASPALSSLLAWRDETARAARVSPATVIDDKLLETVAEAQPTDHDELAAIPGIGRVLASRLGPGLIATLRESADLPG